MYLQDITAAIESIEEFVGDMDLEAFTVDDKTVSAVIRKLEIIRRGGKGCTFRDSIEASEYSVERDVGNA